MIANTYVVKPFGISEVKVIALKGEPGGPTQEQVNAAVEEYMDDHPEAQIPDGTEEYIDTREVPIPVGHNTKYMRDLKKLLEGIPDAPTANGTYVLKATVSSSGVTYSWVAG